MKLFIKAIIIIVGIGLLVLGFMSVRGRVQTVEAQKAISVTSGMTRTDLESRIASYLEVDAASLAQPGEIATYNLGKITLEVIYGQEGDNSQVVKAFVYHEGTIKKQ